MRVLALAALLGVAPSASLRADGDPYGMAELDQEITVSVKRETLGRVFQLLARQANLGMKIEFDPRVKVDLDVMNMSLRAVLQSLAATYGLEYEWGDRTIRVRQKDLPPNSPTGSASVSRRELSALPAYRLALLVRDAQGRALSTPAVTTTINRELVLKHGAQVASRDVVMTLTAVPLEDAGETLKVSLSLVVRRPAEQVPPGETRYREDHWRATRVLGHGETVLFKIDDGPEVVLKDWIRIEGAAR